MNVDIHSLHTRYQRRAATTRRNRRCRLSLSAVAVVLLLAAAGETLSQDAAPECKCRSPDGQMQDLGTVQCVDIAGRKSLVRCLMSTNTPYWKKVDGVSGCPDASRQVPIAHV